MLMSLKIRLVKINFVNKLDATPFSQSCSFSNTQIRTNGRLYPSILTTLNNYITQFIQINTLSHLSQGFPLWSSSYSQTSCQTSNIAFRKTNEQCTDCFSFKTSSIFLLINFVKISFKYNALNLGKV